MSLVNNVGGSRSQLASSSAVEEKTLKATKAELEYLIQVVENESYFEASPRGRRLDDLPSGVQRSNAYAMPAGAKQPVSRSLAPSTSNKALPSSSRVSPSSAQLSLKTAIEGTSATNSLATTPLPASGSQTDLTDSAHSTIRRSGDSAALSREELMMMLDDVARRTTIDQPLCRECARAIMRDQLNRIDELDNELLHYKALSEDIGKTLSTALSVEEEAEERQLIEEENRLREELLSIEKETAEDEQRTDQLEGPLGVITSELTHGGLELEHRLLVEYSDYSEQLHTLRSIQSYNESLLADFQTCNMMSRAFHIWFDGHFGTINGYRLGRLPSQPVEWHEINAAWGDTSHLLVTMAKRINFRFQSFQPLPLGGASRVENLSEKSQYELYGSSDLSLSKMFWSRRYDTAMVMFLSCVKQLADYLILSFPGENLSLPYKIEKDKINDLTIKFSSEEQWTRALKMLLSNLKWMLLWIAAKEPT